MDIFYDNVHILLADDNVVLFLYCEYNEDKQNYLATSTF